MSWESELLRLYDLRPEQYAALNDAQGGCCAICERRMPSRHPRLPVDHDHVSGLLRGLLCTRCNHQLLGMFGDKPALYQGAAAYLLDSPAKYVIGYCYTPYSPGAAGLLKGH